MTTDFQNVADQVKKGAKKLEWITALAEALESVGQIDQARMEAEKAQARAVSDLAKTNGDILAAEGELDSLKIKRSQFEKELAGLQANHQEKMAAITNGHRAKMQAEQENADMALHQARKQSDHAKITAKREVEAMRQEYQSLCAQKEDAREELAEINRSIEEAKAKAKAIFQGFNT